VLPDGAVGEELIALSEDFTEGRKIKRIDDFEAGTEFPRAEESDDTDDAEPIG
jgi:hypothetical protein